MATVTFDLDDGTRVSYQTSVLHFDVKPQIREYTAAEYAAMEPTTWVHRKSVGPAVLRVRGLLADQGDKHGED